MSERLASWFAVVLMTAVLFTSYWYAQTLRVSAPGDSGRIGAVDFFAEGVALTGFDALGRPRYRVFADHMTHFGNSDDIDLTRPRMLSMRPDQPQVEVTALQAHATNNAERVQMQGNVVVTRAGDATRPPLRMLTESLSAVPDSDHFWTDAPVRVESGRAVLNARGMDFDNIARRLQLNGSVSGVFPPRGRS